MKPKIPSINPLTDEQRVEIIRRLLHLARRGQCGPIYAEGWKLKVGVGLRSLGETRWLPWPEAQTLAAGWIDRKPMVRAAESRVSVRRSRVG
jgi:hypothetical protein